VPTTEEQARHWESIGERRTPSHPAVVAFAEPKVDWIRRALAPSVNTMLEVGAGNGYLSVPLRRHFDLTCLDFSDAMLAQNPLPAERKVRGTAEDLPFDDESFDVALCANLLHHLEDPLVAVRQMSRVARHHVVLLEPNADNPLMYLFGLAKKSERGTLKFRKGYLTELGRRAGLRLRASTVQGAVMPNRAPAFALGMLRRLDREHPLGLYAIAVFDV
jgi:SAM-dependent methyltransferase